MMSVSQATLVALALAASGWVSTPMTRSFAEGNGLVAACKMLAKVEQSLWNGRGRRDWLG